MISLPSQGAFAASQNVDALSSWRTVTLSEAEKLEQIYERFGVAAGENSNPENASESSRGWSPNGYTTPAPGNTYFSSIILELPRVNLSCSPNVTLSVEGIGEIVNGTAPSSEGMIRGLMVSSYLEAAVYGGQYPELEADHTAPNTFELDESYPVNPDSVAFGNSLVLSANTWDSLGNTFEWDIHDVSVSYIYDDDDGNCVQTPAGNQVTSCGQDYLNTQGVVLDETTRTNIEMMVGESVLNVSGNPDQMRSEEGYFYNAGLDEIGNQELLRISELAIVPQLPLLQAGPVQLQIQYDFVTPQLDSFVYVMILTGNGEFAPWAVVGTPLQISGSRVVTTYLPSHELENVRMIFMVPTIDMGQQVTSSIHNANATVKQLGPTSVCGTSITSNQPEPTTTTTTTVPIESPTSSIPISSPSPQGPTQEVATPLLSDTTHSGEAATPTDSSERKDEGAVASIDEKSQTQPQDDVHQESPHEYRIFGIFSSTGFRFLSVVIIGITFLLAGYIVHRRSRDKASFASRE